MLRGASPGELPFADKALAHVLTDDKEHLANLVSARGVRASPSCFLSSHIDQQ
jgi:hypothetical protein